MDPSPALNSAHVKIPYPLRRRSFVLVAFFPSTSSSQQKREGEVVCFPSSFCLLPVATSRHHRVVVSVGVRNPSEAISSERPAAMWGYQKEPDLEAGGSQLLYPGMTESPDLRWAFVRKIYVILSVQLVMTAVVSAFVVKVPAISLFFVSSNAGIALFIFLLILPFIGKPSSLSLPPRFFFWGKYQPYVFESASFVRSAVPSALLPPEASSQSPAARPLHRRHQLCCRHDMRLHQR
jgi:hypothetical protein